MRIQRLLHRSSLPEVDVTSLVSPGDENYRGLADDLRDSRLLRRFAIRNDQRGHGVHLAQFIHILVVIVLSMRAKNQKIAAVALAAEPAKRFVKIGAAAHHGNAGVSASLRIQFTAQALVFVRSRPADRGGIDTTQ